jgi:glycosyltransferase involved in cell wall biosynthesis
MSGGFTFVIPTLNAGALLGRCLQSIRDQRFPREQVEILVVDGGSTDDTRAIAERFGATVLPNAQRRAEPGVKLGLQHAAHEFRVIMAADNGLPRRDWLQRVAAAFADDDVRGVYTHVVDAPTDSAFCRYFNRLHADPFNWFVFGSRESNPARFGEAYPVVRRAEHHVIYDLKAGEPPLLAMAQGFAVRGDLPTVPGHEEDDIAPVWAMLQRGERLAYVDAGIWHETVRGFRDFLAKYHRRALSALSGPASPNRDRAAGLSRAQRRRRLLWVPYSLSVVAPLAHALRGVARDRDPRWLIHPVACLALTGVIGRAAIEARGSRPR